jgi:hypothetical protein
VNATPRHMLVRRANLRLIGSSTGRRMNSSLLATTASKTTPPRIHLILDWDGTLTTKDTLHLVSDIGYARNASRNPPLPAWSGIVSAYLEEFKTHEKSYQGDHNTIEEESQWLASLATVESRSVQRVETAGIFQGVRTDDVRRKACEAVTHGLLELRDGWDTLLSTKTSVYTDLTILSVNWSRCFIQSALEYAALAASQLPSGLPIGAVDLLCNVSIKANEIQSLGDDSYGSSGLLSPPDHPGIRTSRDKLTELVALTDATIRQMSEGSKDDGVLELITIYVGDSTTDFDSLLFADIGICVRDDPLGSSQLELVKTFERVGVNMEPLGNLRHPPSQEARINTVWWAKNLREIVDLISRLQNPDLGLAAERE